MKQSSFSDLEYQSKKKTRPNKSSYPRWMLSCPGSCYSNPFVSLTQRQVWYGNAFMGLSQSLLQRAGEKCGPGFYAVYVIEFIHDQEETGYFVGVLRLKFAQWAENV